MSGTGHIKHQQVTASAAVVVAMGRLSPTMSMFWVSLATSVPLARNCEHHDGPQRRQPRREIRVVPDTTITQRLEQRLGRRPIWCAGATGTARSATTATSRALHVAGHLASQPGLADTRLARLGIKPPAPSAPSSAPPATRQAPRPAR